MMIRRFHIFLIACVLLAYSFVLPIGAYAADAKAVDQVKSANQLYETGDYPAALGGYVEAEENCPECPEIAYNQGLAHYRLGELDSAREKFNESLSTTDQNLEANAKYNLGNVAYSEALGEQEDIEKAIDQARMATDFYLDALEINPDDRDARANVESAQRLIKQLIEKQQQQQQQNQDQEQDQDQQDKENEQDQQQKQEQEQEDNQDQQQNSDQQDQQENQEQGDKDQQQQEGGEQNEDQEQQPQPQSGDQQQEEQPSEQDQQVEQNREQKAEPRELTEEEAERLLQAVRDKEASRRKELARLRRAKRVRVERDW